jgi:hypothetical protein
MQPTASRAGAAPDERAASRLADDTEAESDMSAHAALSAHDPLDLSDDDAGNDPYNRTGRFRRNIR